MRFRAIILLLAALLCDSICALANDCIKEQIKEMKMMTEGQEFFRDHSEENMCQIMTFVADPIKQFSNIQDIEDWCSYIQMCDLYFIKFKKMKIGCFGTLMSRFDDINKEKAGVLTFLILTGNSCGLYLEGLAVRYSRLFSISPSVFVVDLKERKNWRDVIEVLQLGDWTAFRIGLMKLGDSVFEKEIKAFALSLERDPDL